MNNHCSSWKLKVILPPTHPPTTILGGSGGRGGRGRAYRYGIDTDKDTDVDANVEAGIGLDVRLGGYMHIFIYTCNR